MELLAATITAMFGLLGIWHIYWALGGTLAKSAAIPEIDGKSAFTPSAIGTFAVAVALLASGASVAVASGLVALPALRGVCVWAAFGLALVLLLRTIGDFRFVGLFKSVRGTRFSRLDTLFYSPLCLALSAGTFLVGLWARG